MATLRSLKARSDAAKEDTATRLTDTLAASTQPITQRDSQATPDGEAKLLQMARLVWFGSLSRSDVDSIGMTQHTNPYQFRKLVFWNSSSTVDLNAIGSQIDGVISSVNTLADSYKAVAKKTKHVTTQPATTAPATPAAPPAATP